MALIAAINLAFGANQPSGPQSPAQPQITPVAAVAATAVPRTATPVTYRLAGSERHAYNYDAKAEIQGLHGPVGRRIVYAVALDDGQRLKAAIGRALLANPSDDTLTRARDAWTNARRSWEQTEAFRFYDGPIDVADIETGEPGPLDRLDGWPVDPAAIDQVEGNPTAGIINDMKVALTVRTLLDRCEPAQRQRPYRHHRLACDRIPAVGRGVQSLGDAWRPPADRLFARPARTTSAAEPISSSTSDLLVEDLHYLVGFLAEQGAKGNYAATFQLSNQREALGRIMNGIGQLAGQELAIRRLAAALDSKDPRLLTSRFSGTSYDDFVFALRGVRNVWMGDYDGDTQTGLEVLVEPRSTPSWRNAHRCTRLDHAEASIAARCADAAGARNPSRLLVICRPAQTAERAIADLKRLASLIRDAGSKLGVQVYLPD